MLGTFRESLSGFVVIPDNGISQMAYDSSSFLKVVSK